MESRTCEVCGKTIDPNEPFWTRDGDPDTGPYLCDWCGYAELIEQ